MVVKLRDFISPFSTSNFEVYITNHTNYQIRLNGREDRDELSNYGDFTVTDVDVEEDMILIWAKEE